MMTPAAAWREVEARQIALVPVFGGKLWAASIEITGDGHNKKRNLRSISATASTPIGAVRELLDRLDAIEQQQLKVQGETE